MKNKLVSSLCLMATALPLQAADPVILVEDSELPNPAIQNWLPEDIKLGPVADGGELLRNLPGISGSRMGGRGIDPIIRGQSQNRLNILLDGAYVHGGCPNRMDPPSAYASLNSYDSITVIKGSQTVVYGGGGSGGTVLFERVTPRFNAGETYRAEAYTGYKSNSDTKQFGADVAAGNQDWFVRAIADYTDANNYEDGDGDTVRSAYETAWSCPTRPTARMMCCLPVPAWTPPTATTTPRASSSPPAIPWACLPASRVSCITPRSTT
jgi:iron complex outermembrane receptor protein